MLEAYSQTSIVAKMGLFLGFAPLVLSVLYAIRPTERRLALMRPLSLAAIFSALCTLLIGAVGVLRGLAATDRPVSLPSAFLGGAEAIVPMFVTFACLTVAWLAVAVGLRRQP